MKTFLETWLLTIPEVLRQELSGHAELVPVENAPSQATALSLTVSVGDRLDERFVVAAEVSALHAVLVEAGLAGTQPDKQRDYELWCEFLKKAATAAARALGSDKEPSVEEAGWPFA